MQTHAAASDDGADFSSPEKRSPSHALRVLQPTLIDAWQATVRGDPAARAVIDGASGRVWTRIEVATAAEAWRGAHASDTSLRGRRVVMAEPNGPRWFEVFLGLLHAGAVPVPGDATEPAAALRETALALRAAALWHDGALERFENRSRARRRDLCLVKLTSGSTGLPRAREFTHAQMLADGRQVCASMGIGPEDLNLAILPLGHSYGLGNLVIPLLAQGTAMVCCASPLPQALAADCVRWGATVFPAVPTLLRALVRAEVEPSALRSLRLVISAGAPLPPEVAAAFAGRFGRRVSGFYGSSETGGISFDASGEATLTGRSVGRPMMGVTLHFRSGRRFTVESAAVMGRGRFSPPDRAVINEHGELELQGRTGRTVKIAGRRLDLGEVERALLAVDGVRAAFAAAHPTRADAVAAAVVSDLAVPALRSALTARIAAWKIPERLVVMEEFPTTTRGKVDTRALRARLASP